MENEIVLNELMMWFLRETCKVRRIRENKKNKFNKTLVINSGIIAKDRKDVRFTASFSRDVMQAQLILALDKVFGVDQSLILPVVDQYLDLIHSQSFSLKTQE